MQDLTRHGAKAEREKMTDTIDTRRTSESTSDFKEVMQRALLSFVSLGNSFDCKQVHSTGRTPKEEKKQTEQKLQKKKQQKALSSKLCQLHQEVPRDSKQTKAVSVFCFPFLTCANLQSSGLPDAMLVQITRLSFKIHRI